jgi:hypothetical protein
MTPEEAMVDAIRFGGYLRNLWELGLSEPLIVDYGDPLPAYRAGFCAGAAVLFMLLEDDAREGLPDELRERFADEVALLAEGYRPE